MYNQQNLFKEYTQSYTIVKIINILVERSMGTDNLVWHQNVQYFLAAPLPNAGT